METATQTHEPRNLASPEVGPAQPGTGSGGDIIDLDPGGRRSFALLISGSNHGVPVGRLAKLGLMLLIGAVAVQAQSGFATSEITSPIKNLVTIANATIAGLAILAVIFYAIKWIGGDEGAAKRIIGVIVVAVIALGAANFLGWVTGKSEFDTFTN